MVLNTDLKEIMMDHALRTISYIADIGDLVVLMARRRFVPHEMDEAPKNRTPKMICHVFESEEAQFIAQSIGQAFQVAYMEFLKANGIEDHSFVKEMDYQEVLNSQEIFGDELQMFAKKEMQKEVGVDGVRSDGDCDVGVLMQSPVYPLRNSFFVFYFFFCIILLYLNFFLQNYMNYLLE